jgi:hypothetical protein
MPPQGGQAPKADRTPGGRLFFFKDSTISSLVRLVRLLARIGSRRVPGLIVPERDKQEHYDEQEEGRALWVPAWGCHG